MSSWIVFSSWKNINIVCWKIYLASFTRKTSDVRWVWAWQNHWKNPIIFNRTKVENLPNIFWPFNFFLVLSLQCTELIQHLFHRPLWVPESIRDHPLSFLSPSASFAVIKILENILVSLNSRKKKHEFLPKMGKKMATRWQ